MNIAKLGMLCTFVLFTIGYLNAMSGSIKDTRTRVNAPRLQPIKASSDDVLSRQIAHLTIDSKLPEGALIYLVYQGGGEEKRIEHRINLPEKIRLKIPAIIKNENNVFLKLTLIQCIDAGDKTVIEEISQKDLFINQTEVQKRTLVRTKIGRKQIPPIETSHQQTTRHSPPSTNSLEPIAEESEDDVIIDTFEADEIIDRDESTKSFATPPSHSASSSGSVAEEFDQDILRYDADESSSHYEEQSITERPQSSPEPDTNIQRHTSQSRLFHPLDPSRPMGKHAPKKSINRLRTSHSASVTPDSTQLLK